MPISNNRTTLDFGRSVRRDSLKELTARTDKTEIVTPSEAIETITEARTHAMMLRLDQSSFDQDRRPDHLSMRASWNGQPQTDVEVRKIKSGNDVTIEGEIRPAGTNRENPTLLFAITEHSDGMGDVVSESAALVRPQDEGVEPAYTFLASSANFQQGEIFGRFYDGSVIFGRPVSE